MSSWQNYKQMKKIIIPIIVISASIMLFLSKCKKEDKEVDYTYNFYDVRWSTDISDNDGDGYVSGAILNCFINLEENVTRNVYAELYFRLEETDEIVYYSSSDEFEFVGVDSPLLITFSIGAAVSELAQGNYKFFVEVYEVGSNRLEASTEGTNLELSQKFERIKNDQNYSVKASWSNDEDNNSDGYSYHSSLSIDVDITDALTKSLRAEIFYKTPGELDDTYTLYKTTSPFDITGAVTSDAVNVNVGREPDTIPHGEYDFKILVYEAFGFFPVATLNYDDDNSLRKSFQKKKDDNYYIKINAETIDWTAMTDGDSDEWASSRTLTVDVDMEKDTSVLDIMAKLYIKHPDSTSYSVFDSTAVFTITGHNTSDAVNFTVTDKYIIQYSDPSENDTIYIDSLRYNFMIEAKCVPFNINITKASISADSIAILKDVQFESVGDD